MKYRPLFYLLAGEALNLSSILMPPHEWEIMWGMGAALMAAGVIEFGIAIFSRGKPDKTTDLNGNTFESNQTTDIKDDAYFPNNQKP